jgi:hypothetical protein
MLTMAKVKSGQTFFSISIQETGSVSNAYRIALANNRNVTDQLISGEDLIIPEGLPITKKDSFSFDVEVVQVSKIKVLALQTFMDIAIQYTGSVKNAYPIALANKRNVTDRLITSEFLILPIALKLADKEVQYYNLRKIKPATGIVKRRASLEDYMFPLEFPISF